MSRLFDDAASEYLANGSAVVSTVPCSMAGWAYPDADIGQAVMGVFDQGGSSYLYLSLQGFVAGDPVRFRIRPNVGAGQNADTTTGFSVNTWCHVCGVARTDTDRACFIDGGSKGTSVVNVALGTVDSTVIGSYYGTGEYFSGRIAEPAIWSCALTDLEVWLLSRGVPPPLIRPQSIVAYWPLWDTDRDVWNARYHMTPFNTPSWALHPPKVLDWWRKYGNRAQTQFALKQFISRQPYNLSYHKPQAFVPTGITRIPRHPAQYNTLAIY